jgi:alanyl-tRNA synthetase
LNRPTDEEVADLISQAKRLEKELEQIRMLNLSTQLDQFIARANQVGSIRLVKGRFDSTDMESLRDLGESLRQKMGAGSVGILGGVDPGGDKVYLVAAVSDDLISSTSLKAGTLVGALAKRVGGGGGGRPTLATAGGKQPENLAAALDAAEEPVRQMVQ